MIKEMNMTLTGYKDGKFSFVGGFDSRNEAIRYAIRWMRQGRGRSAEICIGDDIVWYRG